MATKLAQLHEDLSYLRKLQVTFAVAANGLWTCRVCGAQDIFVNTILHRHGCKLQRILGGKLDAIT
jgi:hypothetical protein